MKETRRFPNRPSSVTQARRYVRDVITGTPPEVADAVELMTSELATNSIRHASTAFEVGVDRGARAIRVEVTDQGPGAPKMLSPGPTQTSGRGLRIVEQLSDEWGVMAAGGRHSKTVWFSVGIPTAS